MQFSILAAESAKLFCLFDKKGIGIISKKSLLASLALIDPQINEAWLQKLMIENGKKLPSYFNCRDFLQLMKVIDQFHKSFIENQ